MYAADGISKTLVHMHMLMAVKVKIGESFEAGVPPPLFPVRPNGVLRYDVTADGQRFLVSPAEEAAALFNQPPLF